MGYAKKNFSGGGRNGGFNRNKQSFKAVCAECGSNCTVPFKPNGRKPVHCSDCYQGSPKNDSGRFSFKEKKPFKRSYDKPVSRHCEADPKLLEEMEQIKRKLNRILDILQAVEIIEETDE